jgi:aminopeptidase
MITDTRYSQLAEGLTGFSCELKKGERVLIDAFDVPDAMVIALIRATRALGALPYVNLHRARVTRELMLGAEEAQYAPHVEVEYARMQKMDAYIALRGSDNIFENSDIPSSRVQLVSKLMKPVLDHRVNKTKWVVLRWPTSAMAQQAGLSTEAFEDFYFKVCTLDYARLIPGMNALKALMDKTDQVHIKGPGTDLRFSIKGIGSQTCGGKRNIPDGEVFSCPVKDSVEGVISYNAPTFSRRAKSSKPPRTTPSASTRFWIVIRARATSANSRSVLIRTSLSRCATFCSTRRSPVPSTSRPVRPMKAWAMATNPKFTGTW